MKFIIPIMILLMSYHLSQTREDKTITCTMRHSAVAALDEEGQIDVHTTDDDEIEVTIEGIGGKTAIFNGTYELTLLKEDAHALYYIQPSIQGLIVWVYFKKQHTVTYAKLRAFPSDGLPSSYLMIAKCEN